MKEPLKKIPIQEFLPHRDPMLMVDYIEEISDKHVVCSFDIIKGNIFVDGFYFQEAGLIEHMAQTCSSIVGQTYYSPDYNPEQDDRAVGFISAIKRLEIVHLIEIGQTIKTTAHLTSKFEGDDYSICTMHVEAKCKDVTCAVAEINLFLQKRK